MRTRAGLAAVAAAVVAVLAACGASPSRAAAGDPQSVYEPRSAPGEGQQFLARMAGEWDVQKTFHRRGGGEPQRSSGRCTQTMIHGGRFLRSEFEFTTDQGTSTGTGLIGFDPASGTFTSSWIDSRSTRVSLRQSEGAFDGAQIELQSRTLGQPEDASRRSRTVTRFDDQGRLVHRQYRLGDDGQQSLVMELLLTRRTGSGT